MPDTGFKYPTVTVSQSGWTVYHIDRWKADDALANQVMYGTPGDSVTRNFGFSVPSGNKIDGFEAQLKIGTSSIAQARGQMSWDGGVSYSDWKWSNVAAAEGWKTCTWGGATDLWGSHAWTRDETNDTNFRMRLFMNNGGILYGNWEYFWLKVYYSAASEISKVGGVSLANIAKVCGVSLASISKICGKKAN